MVAARGWVGEEMGRCSPVGIKVQSHTYRE